MEERKNSRHGVMNLTVHDFKFAIAGEEGAGMEAEKEHGRRWVNRARRTRDVDCVGDNGAAGDVERQESSGTERSGRNGATGGNTTGGKRKGEEGGSSRNTRRREEAERHRRERNRSKEAERSGKEPERSGAKGAEGADVQHGVIGAAGGGASWVRAVAAKHAVIKCGVLVVRQSAVRELNGMVRSEWYGLQVVAVGMCLASAVAGGVGGPGGKRNKNKRVGVGAV